MKYVQVPMKISDPMKQALSEIPARSGLYNWLFVFRGEMKPYDQVEDFEDYDVVHVNMSPADQVMIPYIRDRIPKSSSTILVLNNDYVCEAWGSWGQHPLYYEKVQECADMLFGTEPYQTSHLIKGAYCFPHPTKVDVMRHLRSDDYNDPEVSKHYSIASMYHWWEGQTYSMSLLANRLKRKLGKVHSRLYAYNGQNDKNHRWQRLLFDEHMKMMDFPNFIKHLATNNLFVEGCGYHTYGRTTVDSACAGIPTVGSDRVFSMRHCWPKCCCDPFDLDKMEKVAMKLLTNPEWREEQLSYATEAVEYFNYENSKERFMAALEDTRKRLGK